MNWVNVIFAIYVFVIVFLLEEFDSEASRAGINYGWKEFLCLLFIASLWPIKALFATTRKIRRTFA